jgi:hypothetical protein
MRNMSPEDMKRQMDSANAQSGAQQQYYFKARGDAKRSRLRRADCPLAATRLRALTRSAPRQASEMLKTQGNQLVKCVPACARVPQRARALAPCVGLARVASRAAHAARPIAARQGVQVRRGGGEV